MATTPFVLAELWSELDRCRVRIPLDTLVQRLRALEIRLEDLAQAVHFGRDTYQRNHFRSGPAYQALVLCWRSGQRSPIHDHRGSSCGMYIVKGVATETLFQRTAEGLVYATGSHELREGSVCGSQDDDLHQVSNLQPPGCDLITLHVYSPPLLNMGMYSLSDPIVRTFVDPVVGFVGGDGI
jgi:cysteine dioxygenase